MLLFCQILNTVRDHNQSISAIFLNFLPSVNCGVPSPPVNGFLGNIAHTREGATVTFQCSDGYVPSAVMTSTCTSTRLWAPTPENHTCTLVIGTQD